MIEDKLTIDQRIRLEALNQAVHTGGVARGTNSVAGDILKTAERYEAYIRGDNENEKPETRQWG